MSDLLQAAEALLYVLGSDHSQADYQTAHDNLAQAVTDAGGTIQPAPAASAPGFAPTLDDAKPADLVPDPVEPVAVAASNEAHDETVATVTETVAAVAADPAPDAHAQAEADIDAALAQWPDSPQLQDLKKQLDSLVVAPSSGEAA